MSSLNAQATRAVTPELDVGMAQLTFPAFGTAVLAVSYGIIDSFFLSKISTTAAAAVGGVFSFLAMCAFLLRNFAQAGGIVASQYIGAQQHDKLASTFSVCLTIGLVLGAVLSTLIYGLHAHIGTWLGFSAELNAFSSQYLKLASIIVFTQAISFSYLVFIALQGYTSWNFLVVVAMNLVNIVCNYLLMVWQDGRYLSVAGVAYATLVSQCVVLLICFYMVHSKLRIPFIHWVGREEFRNLARHIVRIGIPSSLFPVSLQLNLLALVVIITRLGPDMLSTQVYTINIIMLTIAWTAAVAQSSQIYISRLVGAGRFKEANSRLQQNIVWGISGVLFSTACFYLFSDSVYGLMTHNPVILSTGATLLLMGLILEPLRAVNLIVLASLNATGDAKFPGLLSILMMWLIGLPMSWLFGLSLEFGLVGVYIGRIIDEGVRSLIVYSRWRSGIWETKCVTLNAAVAGVQR